jgi:purine-binding chemotaxis protein CheW
METKETINQFLTFAMGKELYAIRVCNVREVLTVPKVTRIPRMPEYMKGVVNIRGSVVPILVVEIQFGGDGEILNLGIFADSVKKVVAIQTSEIEAPPKIGSRIDTSFIEGMGHADDDFIVILNIAEILTAEDFKAFESAQVSEVSS